MNKISRLMSNKKFWLVLMVMIAAISFLVLPKLQAGTQGGDPKIKNEEILKYVGMLLEHDHYSPKTIDDNFSKEVLGRFETDLDGDKSIFIQSDINSFKKYENK